MPDEPVSFEHFQVARREDGSLFELGRGAMGVTYKAYDTRLDGYVALKVINPGYLHDDTGRERFLREARAAAHLDHPNVAAIFHRGQEGGTYFYAMQFIEGETLDAYVRRRGPLPVALALRLVLQAAQGLAAANARGLIHRDIKPANLMLVHLDGSGLATSPGDGGSDEDLLVKVIDFGLAKAVLDDKAGTELSLTGEGPIGTPYYMSPEQIDASVGEVDARTDIYSLGITLWYLLMGQPPFVGTQFQVFRQHMGAPPPLTRLPAAVPENVRTLLGRMMAKTPEERPANMRELIAQLRELLRGPTLAHAAAAITPAAPAPAPQLPPPVPDPASGWSDTPPPLPARPRESFAAPAAAPASPADTHRPPPIPAATTTPPVPVVPYVPPASYLPPTYPSAAAARRRSWLVFIGVVLGALVLGGIPLGYYISRSGRDKPADNPATPSPTAVASATPAATAAPTATPAASRPSSASAAAGVTPAASPANTPVQPPGNRSLSVPGQYATIQAAIDAAHAGDTVRVGAGTFREKLTFKAGIRLVGSGMNNTIVSVPGDGEAFQAKNCASGSVSGFTFEHNSPNPSGQTDYVAWLDGSAVEMRNCRVRNSGSIGLSCEHGDRSLVEDCEFTANRNHGLRSLGAGTAPTFRGNRSHHNARSGVIFAEGARGTAENNTSENNTEFGFAILDADTAPALTGNTARRNTMSGFTYQGGAGGTADNNAVEDNQQGGFRLSDKGTAPTLTNNRVRGSGLSGFIVLEGAGGTVSDNTSEENSGSGVLVKGAGTVPMLTGNRLTGNKLSGMLFTEGAGGTARSNTISGNTEAGVYVSGKGTAPAVQQNEITNNSGDGINVRDGAAGTLEGNTCTNNAQRGIGIYGAGTSPVLGTNKTENNPKGNTFIEKGATPKKPVKYDEFFR